MFHHLCKERSGEVWRKVRLMDRSVARILDVVEKLKTIPSFLPKTEEIRPFIQPDNIFLEIDDVGLIAVIPTESRFAHVHITFWDRKLHGREELCRTVAEWIVGLTGMVLATGIPQDSRVVLAFAKRVGFQVASVQHGIVVLTFPNYPE